MHAWHVMLNLARLTFIHKNVQLLVNLTSPTTPPPREQKNMDVTTHAREFSQHTWTEFATRGAGVWLCVKGSHGAPWQPKPFNNEGSRGCFTGVQDKLSTGVKGKHVLPCQRVFRVCNVL